MEPKYKIIKKSLLKLVEENGNVEDFQLPTEHGLMEQYGYSRNTVRQALRELEHEGSIYRIHGKGTFLKGKKDGSDLKEKQDSGLIGLVNFYFLDYIYPEIMRGIEDRIYKEGYSLVLSNCNLDHTKELESVQRILDQGIKGLIIEPSRNTEITEDHPLMVLLRESGIPIVTTHWNPSEREFSMVTINDVKAGYSATSHLIEKGHKDIAIIYKEDVQAGQLRLEGYLKALEENHLEADENWILGYTDKDEAAESGPGYLKTMELLKDKSNHPSAIFYFNDSLAINGYKAIRELGLEIPKDISVVGFDDFSASALVSPPLTTFAHPKYILGKWAAQILLEEMDPTHRPLPMQLLFEPVFVERESVKSLH